jgi:acetyl-CoA carboxylase biotin carboxyl carrier protein
MSSDDIIITLVDKFNESSIAELEYRDEKSHLILRKESAVGKSFHAVSRDSPGSETYAGHTEAADSNAVKPRKHNTGTVSKGEAITSPIVATFYAAASPDAPPFVQVGTKVKTGDSLCILEAMKMLNQFQAEFDCEILSILVKNGDFVEFGQTLFEVKRL